MEKIKDKLKADPGSERGVFLSSPQIEDLRCSEYKI